MTKHYAIKRSMDRLKKSEKGFSLIEIMVAVCVLGVGLLAISSMQVGAVNSNGKASDVSEAVTLAERRIETLMSLPYRFNLADDNQNPVDLQDTDNLGTAGLLYPFPASRPTFDPAQLPGWIAATPPDHQRTVVRDKRSYQIFWNVATDAEIVDTKTIEVIVCWNNNDIGKMINVRRVVPRIM